MKFMHRIRRWHWRFLHKPSPDHRALVRVRLNDVLLRLEHERRSASIWNGATIAFAGLLWLWLQAPSFDLLPGIIRTFLRVVGFLGAGIFGVANSSVAQAADYINLGYGVLFGPIILFFVSVGWLAAEKRVIAVENALHENMERNGQAAPPPNARSWRSLGFTVAALAMAGSTVATLNRFFDFHGHEADLVCAREEVCRPHENYWVAPWVGAEQSKLSWLQLHVDDSWCVAPSPGWPPGFRAVIRDQYFTRQIERLPKYVCSGGSPHPQQDAKPASAQVAGDPNGSLTTLIKSMIAEAIAKDPYQRFPYVYPLINLPLLLIFGLGQFYILLCIATVRRGGPRLPRTSGQTPLVAE